ncbi:MAG: Glu-tRNA(Gln) amidotransferase subunit GatD [Candidatus Thermoplasmatota archaeon]|nr:Glu-tRNA(Gln) amidotransferase subunit GatD [Candidatus Thermoplasmatota archaeon]
MSYKGIAKKVLELAKAHEGDEIEVIKEKSLIGILMPRHEFSAENIITLKLPNGYNIGVEIDSGTKIKMIKEHEKKKPPLKSPPLATDKLTISLLSTGGTIASYVDYRTGAVKPALTAQELAFAVPELTELYNIRAKVLFSIFSEDMCPLHWKKLAKEVAKELSEGSDAVIIPHGTDTLHYTSAALSFMLRNLPSPVILVGSQRSSDRPSSDAVLNLLGAAKLATTDLGEVVVVMHGSRSDDFLLVHRGTKVRKMHTSARDAFKSINCQPLAKIQNNDIKFLQEYAKRSSGNLEINTKLEERVAFVYFYPGMSEEYFECLAKNNKGLVIAGTGLGHVSEELLSTIKKYSFKIPIVMSSQCLAGRVNMNVYSRGRDLLGANVIAAEDMLPEVAYIKLMLVLGKTKKMARIKELMQKNYAGEISERREL